MRSESPWHPPTTSVAHFELDLDAVDILPSPSATGWFLEAGEGVTHAERVSDGT